MSKADSIIDWMLGDGRQTDHDMNTFGRRLAERIIAAGIPITRFFWGVRTLHPLVGATGYIWRRESGAVVQRAASWDETNSAEFQRNPVLVAVETGAPFRCRLDSAEPLDHPILEELRRDGLTEYLALAMTFSDGNRNPVSFQTDAPDGFATQDIEALERVANAMALFVESETRYRTARQLLETYVGKRTGERVLSGAIQRGMGETISAVVWFSDLRGFTALSESLPNTALLDHLNTYFELVGGAVTEEGGEILKFIGDGVLAIFEITPSADTADRCAAAWRAAQSARLSILKANRERIAKDTPEIEWGLALNLGDVSYGNIGTPDRLDFTVIGPAVNHAARLEALGAQIGETVVLSESVAQALGAPLRDLGAHSLKGVALPQKAFAPAD